MALSKITYDTKVALSPQPSVANANKVSDSDMNEIKSVVNDAIDKIESPQTTRTTSDTDTYSCNYINDKLGWTFIGTTTGNAGISLPSGWNELYACVSLGTSASIFNTVITNSVFVGTTNKQLRFGYYLTSTSNAGGSIYITTSGTKAQTIENFADNSNVLANTTTYWYYK